MGVLSIGVWVTVFGIGAIVPSEPYRTVLGSHEISSLARGAALIAAIVTYTPTNIAILCCVASITGSSGIRHDDSLEKYRSSVVRGFFVYILLMSGLLLISGDPFNAPTQSQYIRLAGMSAVFGFIVGWHPGVVAKLMDNVMQAVKLKDATQKTTVVQTTEMHQETDISQTTRVQQLAAAESTSAASTATTGSALAELKHTPDPAAMKTKTLP